MKRVFFVISLLCCFAAAQAQIPETLTYQGVLTDASGKNLPDGQYNLTFTFYDATTAGNSLWTETQTVEVRSGVFDAILGKQKALNVAFDKPYWLGLKVGTQPELAPRVQLTSSAYSLNARGVADNAVTSAKIAAGQVVKSVNGLKDDVNLTAGNNVTIDKTGNTLKISAQGGTGGGNGWTVAGDNMYSNVSGNVGIGTTTPDHTLVVGPANGGRHLVVNDVATGRWGFSTGEFALAIQNDWENKWRTRMFISKEGYVGIGNENPDHPLVVGSGSGRNLVINDAPTARWGFATGDFGLRIQNDWDNIWTTRVHITKDGYVGIGTMNPLRKLHITGNEVTAGVNRAGIVLEDLGANQMWTLNCFGNGAPEGVGKFGINQVGLGNRFIIDQDGNIGIGTTNPLDKLHIAQGGIKIGSSGSISQNWWEFGLDDGETGTAIDFHGGSEFTDYTARLYRIAGDNSDFQLVNQGTGLMSFYTNNAGPRMAITGDGNVGIGTTAPAVKLDVAGNSVFRSDPSSSNVIALNPGDNNVGVELRSGTNGGNPYIDFTNDISTDFDARIRLSGDDLLAIDGAGLNVDGTTTTKVLTITGGADLAEPFAVTDDETLDPGSVVVIDDANPGQLKLSEKAYDTRVAGIISGAGGVNPGLTLSQEDQLGKGQNVALSGRVYAKASAANGAIKPGDLLTSSDLPGHLMKATDRGRAYGSVLGKAMTGLETGDGLVLVLVNLQ